MSDVLAEFGYRVRDARIRKGWKLEDVAREAFANPDRKGYVSQIENGKIRISPRTVGNLARVLELPESVTEPMLRQQLPAEDEVAKADRDAERLMRVVQADGAVTPPSEALLISLAYEFARGSHLDLMTAYNGLKAALADAADLKARGMLPQNTGDQVQTVLRRVAELNDQGLKEEAATEVDRAIADLDALHVAQKSALVEIAITQDRIRNNPEAAAKRLIAKLKSEAHAGGLFRATRHVQREWSERGNDMGVNFDLEVALNLARHTLSRAKAHQRGDALTDLGICLSYFGMREVSDTKLKEAIGIFRGRLACVSRKVEPKEWASSQSNLGASLQMLGIREVDSKNLIDSITALSKALTIETRERSLLDWASTQNNLGISLQFLGQREGDKEKLTTSIALHTELLDIRTRDKFPLDWAGTQNNLGLAWKCLGAAEAQQDKLNLARDAFAACELEHNKEHLPFLWGRTQWNIADLELAFFNITADPVRLTSARAYALAAREVFVDSNADHQVDECDDLLARIDATAASSLRSA